MRKHQNWSELCSDVLALILKRLSFTDFARAKTVCSSWNMASKFCSPKKNKTPWLMILHDSKSKYEQYWTLFNPEEQRFYQTEHLGDFSKDHVLTTCGNWVLMLDEELDIYILNPFTREILNLPSLDSNPTAEITRSGNYTFDISYLRNGLWFTGGFRVGIGSVVLWVDERTNDYFVAWSFDEHTMGGDYIAYCRTGDEEWREIPRRNGCLDMAYKDNKLYMCTFDGSIRILGFDDSGLARDIINHPYTCPLGIVSRYIPENPYSGYFRTNSMCHVKVGIRLTVSGDVLMVLRVRAGESNRFEVYKMVGNKWENVYFLGEEEALVWDLSVTLPTKGVKGIKKDSIYYCHTYKSSREIAAFVMSTQSCYQPFEQHDLLLGDARWFFPCFGTPE